MKPCSTSYWRYWLLGQGESSLGSWNLDSIGFKEQMQIPEDSFSRLSLKAALLKQAVASLTTDPVISLDRDLSNWGADRSPALPLSGSRQDLTPPDPDYWNFLWADWKAESTPQEPVWSNLLWSKVLQAIGAFRKEFGWVALDLPTSHLTCTQCQEKILHPVPCVGGTYGFPPSQLIYEVTNVSSRTGLQTPAVLS